MMGCISNLNDKRLTFGYEWNVFEYGGYQNDLTQYIPDEIKGAIKNTPSSEYPNIYAGLDIIEKSPVELDALLKDKYSDIKEERLLARILYGISKSRKKKPRKTKNRMKK